MNATAPSRDGRGQGLRTRHWFSVAGIVVILVTVLPPVATLAQRYVLVETVQFSIFSLVAPLLFVLGAPWRFLRLSRTDPSAAPNLAGAPAGPADRIAVVRQHHRSFLRSAIFLLVFMGVSLAWRLPPALAALVSQPGLLALELVSLVAAGTGLWLELIASPPLRPRLPRPQRAALAALAMWFTWVVAYVIAMNTGAVFATYGNLPNRALSLLADQEIAAAIMWIVAGFSFMPIVFTSMLGWLKDSDDAEEELQRMVRDEHQRAVVKGWGRPPKNPKARPTS